MHELSIAISIVDLAIDQAVQASANSVSEVELDIGIFSGIEYEALEFSLGVASKDTMLEETMFRINRVEPVAECPDCGHLYSPEGVFSHCIRRMIILTAMIILTVMGITTMTITIMTITTMTMLMTMLTVMGITMIPLNKG